MKIHKTNFRGGCHSYLSKFQQFYLGLKLLNGAEFARPGKFGLSKAKNSGIYLQFVDPTTRTIRLKIVKGVHEQYFEVCAKPGRFETMQDSLEDFIGQI